MPPPIVPGLAKVAPFREEAFKLATLVVEETTNGAVPVEIVEVNWFPLTLPSLLTLNLDTPPSLTSRSKSADWPKAVPVWSMTSATSVPTVLSISVLATDPVPVVPKPTVPVRVGLEIVGEVAKTIEPEPVVVLPRAVTVPVVGRVKVVVPLVVKKTVLPAVESGTIPESFWKV